MRQLLLSFAFNFNLSRYVTGEAMRAREAGSGAVKAAAESERAADARATQGRR